MQLGRSETISVTASDCEYVCHVACAGYKVMGRDVRGGHLLSQHPETLKDDAERMGQLRYRD
jgi:hypothetical protein